MPDCQQCALDVFQAVVSMAGLNNHMRDLVARRPGVSAVKIQGQINKAIDTLEDMRESCGVNLSPTLNAMTIVKASAAQQDWHDAVMGIESSFAKLLSDLRQAAGKERMLERPRPMRFVTGEVPEEYEYGWRKELPPGKGRSTLEPRGYR